MWVFRELSRLIEKIAIAVVVAIVIAELRTLISGGDRTHALQISLILIGALLVMMAAVGPGTNYERRLTVLGRYWEGRAGVEDREAQTGPVLTANAVFVLSGAIVIALGLVV